MVKHHPVSRPKNRVKASPKIKKDLINEYQESIKKKGVVEVLTLTDDDCLANVKQHISTQSLGLDNLLNGSGIPTGRVTEIYGQYHIGKSTLMDHLFASVQKMGGVGVLFDVEAARDIRYTESIGVNTKELQLVEFAKNELHIENVMDRLYETIEWWHKNAPDVPVVIGWDALGGTATKDELSKDQSEHIQPAGAAKAMRSAARKIPTKLGNTQVAVVIANHEYESFGKGGFGGGTKKETYGGAAVRHLASIRLKLFPMGWVKRGDVIVGRRVGASLEKNRLGNPFGKTEVALISGVGIDNVWTLYEELKEAKIIVAKGTWSAINLDGEVIKFQGWNGLVKQCAEDKTLFDRLVSVYNTLG